MSSSRTGRRSSERVFGYGEVQDGARHRIAASGRPALGARVGPRDVCRLIHLVGRAVAIKDARPLLSRFRYLSLKSPSSAVMTRGRMAAVACRQSRRPRHVVAFSASSMVARPRVAIGRMGLTVLALAAPLITITTIHRQGSRCPTVRLAQVPPNPAIPPPASDEVSRGEPAGCPTPRG